MRISAAKRVGQKFGRLTVMAIEVKSINGKNARFRCFCDCGNDCVVCGGDLFTGLTQSCGCLRRERIAEACTIHGYARRNARTRVYQAWKGMRGRCRNKNSADYPDYGGRGITVCERWESFENFLQDMGEPPTGHSLDRINANGNYEPSNCRWATDKTQSQNRRTAKLITHNGKTQCVAEWTRELGFKRGTVQRRLELGWSAEKALTTPLR